MCHFRLLLNGMFDRHQAEMTVMQFTGLPVHQSESVPWDFTLSHIVSQARLRQWNMQLPRLWNGMSGLVEDQYTTISKTQEMILDTTLLSTQHYMVRIKGKVEQSWEWSSTPTPQCSSYWKGSLRVTLNKYSQLMNRWKSTQITTLAKYSTNSCADSVYIDFFSRTPYMV